MLTLLSQGTMAHNTERTWLNTVLAAGGASAGTALLEPASSDSGLAPAAPATDPDTTQLWRTGSFRPKRCRP